MKIQYITSLPDLKKYLHEILDTAKRYIALDTETSGLDPHSSDISIIQLYNGTGTCYIVDWLAVLGSQAIKYFNGFLKQAKERKFVIAFQNAKFDIKFLWKAGIETSENNIFDTMIAAQLIGAGIEHNFGMKDIASRYLGIAVSKDEQKSDWTVRPLSAEQLKYAAEDGKVTYDLAQVLKERILVEDLSNVFRLEMRTVFATAAMEWFGMPVDIPLLKSLEPAYTKLRDDAQQAFLSLVKDRWIKKDLFGNILDEGLNLSSSQQILPILRGWGVENPNYKPKTAKGWKEGDDDKLIRSTDKNTYKLLDLEKHPELVTLMQYKQYDKLLTGYVYQLPTLINPVTGRLHVRFNQCVSTGRFSCSQPNLQTLPRADGSELNIRKCFSAPKGSKLLSLDYAQIELRVMAEILYVRFGDRTQLQEFLDGKDPYAASAAGLSNMTYEQFQQLEKSEYKKRRQSAKAVRLGFAYGMQSAKFKSYARQTYGVTMSAKEAEASRDRYFKLYPALQKYHDSFKSKSILTCRTAEPFKRIRKWSEYAGVPQLANFPVQGGSADMQKLAMAMAYERLYAAGYSPLQSNDIKLVMTIHDEIVIEVVESKGEFAKELLEKCMVEAGQFVLKHVPVEAEGKLMDNLSEKD